MGDESGTILQFGTGRFLRSFVDLFAQEANEAGAAWKVVAVQSTDGERARQLNRGLFNVVVRGLADGQVIDSVKAVRSVVRGISADQDWKSVLATAEDPALRLVVSNTTEAGLALDRADATQETPPRSYPAKLLAVLLARRRAGLPGLRVFPCELVEGNGRILRDLVQEQAGRWGVDDEDSDWIRNEVEWCDTLVDRIVSAPPDDHPMLTDDPLLSVAEPFAFWAIASDRSRPLAHPAIEMVDDVTPFSVRKVRILNGAHTALVAHALGRFTTVREAMADPETRTWMQTLIHEELVPCVDTLVDGADAFADSVIERFDNPFLDHRLEDIALHQDEKVKVRLMPSYHDYQERFGRRPKCLSQVLVSYV